MCDLQVVGREQLPLIAEFEDLTPLREGGQLLPHQTMGVFEPEGEDRAVRIRCLLGPVGVAQQQVPRAGKGPAKAGQDFKEPFAGQQVVREEEGEDKLDIGEGPGGQRPPGRSAGALPQPRSAAAVYGTELTSSWKTESTNAAP